MVTEKQNQLQILIRGTYVATMYEHFGFRINLKIKGDLHLGYAKLTVAVQKSVEKPSMQVTLCWI